MGYVTRKASTAKSKYSVTHFDELKTKFLEDVKVTVQLEEIRVSPKLGPDRHQNGSYRSVHNG